MEEWTDEEFSRYCKEACATCLAEMDEIELGIHPTQINQEEE